MTVNGQDGAANTTLTDGSRNVNVGLPYHNVYIAPAETIETVTITTGSMDAEQGMAAGAAITVTTKSGTNIFKGSAFEFFNNQKLNADAVYFRRAACRSSRRAAHVRRDSRRSDHAQSAVLLRIV